MRLLARTRVARDIDLFHDSEEALSASWDGDRDTLTGVRERIRSLGDSGVPVIRGSADYQGCGTNGTTVGQEWARDSAYRFFPLITDETMGLTLHPFDLATNKVLALAGRLEVRHWLDVLNCDRQIQPLGYLIWAACGKDPGYSPQSLLAASMRQHYSQAEVNTLEFNGRAPDAGRLGHQWHTAQREASSVIGLLPPEMVGTCVAGGAADLFRGTIGGSWPTVKA